jgi:hypothetical protein
MGADCEAGESGTGVVGAQARARAWQPPPALVKGEGMVGPASPEVGETKAKLVPLTPH